VLNPCSDIAAIMGEIANIPSPCKNNVEGVLNKNELTYFNALLLATGVQRPIFSSGEGPRALLHAAVTTAMYECCKAAGGECAAARSVCRRCVARVIMWLHVT
jgi:hypothetical protein